MPHNWPLYLAAWLSPSFLWALLAIFSRRRPSLLPRLYPWVKAICWALWITSVVLMSVGVLSDAQRKPFFRLWFASWGIYGGLMLITRGA